MSVRLCTCFYVDVVCFQKISRPPPQRELEIREVEGAHRPRKFQWGGGFEDQNSLSEGMYNNRFSPTFVSRSDAFVGHAAFFLPCFGSKRLFFFIKVFSKQTSCHKR